MVAQIVVVIQDASREINSKVFHWAPSGLSLKPGDSLILVAVLHQVITPLGYRISVDSRLTFGADQKIIEAEVARKKKEYMKNEELAQIYKLYKSMKVGFKIEIAMGSSPKAVALKTATKLKATWVILDRKMKNDEEYFIQKLSCSISRIKSSNKIVHLREPLDTPQQRRRDRSSERYADSIPQEDFSTEQDLFSIDISHKTLGRNQTGETNLYQLSMDEKEIHSEQLQSQREEDQQWQGEEQNLNENNSKMQELECLSNEMYQRSERYLYSGGARNFFLGGAEEYTLCEQFFNLSNFHM